MNKKQSKKLKKSPKKNFLFQSFGLGTILLTAFSMFSSGFSSWVIAPLSGTGVNIDVSVGDVINTNFFSISKTDIKMFTLGPNGMIEDETIVDSSSIEVSFYIDNVAAYPVSNSGVLNFELCLSCSNQSFLNSYINDPTISGAVNVSSSITGSEKITSASYTISDSGNTKVTAIYKVIDKADSNGKYMSDLYYSNKPTFNFRVRG